MTSIAFVYTYIRGKQNVLDKVGPLETMLEI